MGAGSLPASQLIESVGGTLMAVTLEDEFGDVS